MRHLLISEVSPHRSPFNHYLLLSDMTHTRHSEPIDLEHEPIDPEHEEHEPSSTAGDTMSTTKGGTQSSKNYQRRCAHNDGDDDDDGF